MPAVDKVQKHVEALAMKQAADAKVLNSVHSKQDEAGKAVEKVAATVKDNQERLLEVKDYSKVSWLLVVCPTSFSLDLTFGL